MRCDAKGCEDEWDAEMSIRSRLREGGSMLLGTLHEFTVARCAANSPVLVPLLVRIVAAGGKLPDIEGLREAVEGLMRLSSRDVDEGSTDDMSWECRKLCSYVKRKTKRREVSVATRLKLLNFGWFQWCGMVGKINLSCR